MSENYLYEREALALGQENSLSKLLTYIPYHASVLDVGCATGRLGEYLQKNTTCIVDGIEANTESARIAQGYYRTVYPINLEAEDAFSLIEHDYDVIVLADVLEHLRYPEQILQELATKLTPQGKFLISIPNVGHIGVMLQLLQGTFVYQQQGLLDKTHVRFFSQQNLTQFFADAQLKHWRLLDRVIVGTQGSEFNHSLLQGIAPTWLAIFAALPESNTYQFLLEASPNALLDNLEYEQEKTHSIRSLNNGIYINVTLHYCTSEHPNDYQALTHLCYLHEQMFTVTFSLPSNITKLRFDPADIAGIMQLERCQLQDASHTPIWTLTQQSHIIEQSASLTMAWSDNNVVALDMLDADPWFVLPVSIDTLGVARSFVVQFSWPHTHDYWLLEAQWRDKNKQLQQQVQAQQQQVQVQQQEHNELKARYQQLYVQFSSIKLVVKQLLSLLKNKLVS